MRGNTCLLATALFSACWSAPRPAPPRHDAAIALPIEELQLPNGLRVVVVPEPASTEVSVTMRYAVGSGDDPSGKEGLAHLVEHLMFEHARGDTALFDVLERRALSFNGFTTTDATLFTQRGPAGDVAEMLELESVRMLAACSAIPASAFARQREIVRNELQEREQDERVQALLRDALFGRTQARATPSSVATLTQDDACAFAAAHYTASNAVLVMSGGVRAAEVKPLLERTLGRAPRGEAIGRAAARTMTGAAAVTVDAPVQRPWFVLAWPLPADLAGQVRLRVVVSMAAGLVNARVNGLVTTLEVGSGTSAAVAIAIAPSRDVSASDALDNAKDAIARMGHWFRSGLYEHTKQRALYTFAASLDPSTERDVTLASEAATSRDVRAKVDAALRSLASMSRDDAESLVSRALDPAKATIVSLRPTTRDSRAVSILTAEFSEQRRRIEEDAREAQQPVTTPMPANPLARGRIHTLANGLRVVMLPLATMPTVDIRLVLPVGTADEAEEERGVALVAAHALEAPLDARMFEILKIGGRVDKDVTFDQTVFSTSGLASRLDMLLDGLATTLREGIYDIESVRNTASSLTMSGEHDPTDRVASAALRDALYGAGHPYRLASQWHHAKRNALELDVLQRFRRRHYQPSGATLVISGAFDAENAARWVEHYFKEWAGSQPHARKSPPTAPRGLAFAQRTDLSQLAVIAAFELPGDSVAQQIVAEMVTYAVSDVREQLAASYGLRTVLVQRRLGTSLELSGFIDVTRVSEALTLLRERLAKLHADDDIAAAAFVAARRRVATRLSSVYTNATMLADRVVKALATSAELRLDLADAQRARTMTFDQVRSLVSRLDLTTATMLVRGPDRAVTAAYAAIGRTPAYLE